MTDPVAKPNLLVLSGGRPTDDTIVKLLQSACRVCVSADLPEALDLLRGSAFDAVLAAAGDFLPLERALAGEQAAAILDAISEGACVVGLDGRLLWANAKFKAFRAEMGEALLERIAAAADAGGGRSVLTAGERQVELDCSVVRTQAGKATHVTAVVFDTTDVVKNHAKLDAMGEAGRELAWLDGGAIARMSVGERLKFLEERIVHYTGALLHRDHFALWLLNERSRQLELIAAKGMPASLAARAIRLDGADAGVPGEVARGGQSVLAADLADEPRHRPLALPDAASSLTVPVRLSEKVIGVLSFESHRTGTFSEIDRQFIEIFAGYIALAVNTLNLMSVERHSATSEITGVVSSELGGPLTDIRQEAQALIAEYIGHDEMRKRLERIVATVDSIEQTVDHIAAQPVAAMMGAMPVAAAADPLLAGKHVLVADDEEMIRETIHDVLVRAGAFVDVARDGREAVEMIGAADYDLVLSDIKMPYCDGYEVFSAAKARRADAAVILITGFGYDPSHSIVRANPEGLAAVLFKPFKVQQLLEEVRGALGA